MSTKLVAISGLVLLLAALNAARVESQRRLRPIPPSLPQLPPGCHYEWRWQQGAGWVTVPVCADDVPVNPTPANSPPPPSAQLLPSLFVFGDSFADNGNLPDTPDTQHPLQIIRQWYIPYGSSYGMDDGSAAEVTNSTGRFSNYKVQSDFIGKILGINEAPPPYLSTGSNGYCDSAGMTFAAGGSGVYPVPLGVPTLSEQLDNFERLIRSECITRAQIEAAVVLVAVSGNDYDRVRVVQPSSLGDITAFTKNVTSEIAAAVARLEAVGMNKILVNNLHPVGCTPAQTQTGPGEYGECDVAGNTAAKSHNQNLQHLLASDAYVFIVDLYSAFTNIVDKANAGRKDLNDLTRKFKNLKTPCCQPNDPKGFCGAMGGTQEDPKWLHTVCANPAEHFYWDEMHPTQAGWTAVMAQLQDPIQQFIWPSDR